MGPGFLITLAIYLLLFSIAEATRPKPPKGLGDFKFPTRTGAIPFIHERATYVKHGPNIVWYGDVQPVVETGPESFTVPTVDRAPLPSEVSNATACAYCDSVVGLSRRGCCRNCGASRIRE